MSNDFSEFENDFTSDGPPNDWENFESDENRATNAQRKKNLFELMAVVLAVVIAAAVILFTKFGHEHVWQEASCTQARVCTECAETEGEPLGHKWLDASCTTAKVCLRCTEKEGEALGHDWLPATDMQPSRCVTCNIVSGRSLGYELTRCAVIGDSNSPGSTKDVGIGDWTDTFGSEHEDSIRFWVADFGSWNPEEHIQYDLGGQFAELELTIAPEENSGPNTRGKILVYCGTELLYESDWLTDTTPPVCVRVDVSGCSEIKILSITDSRDFYYCVVDGMLYN